MLALAALVLVTACFYRSGRETTSPAPEELQPARSAATPDASSNQATVRRPDTGDFVVQQPGSGIARFQQLDSTVRAERLLEKAAEQLNRALILPYDISIRSKECGEQNAFYDSRERSVTICYELMDRFYQTFRRGGSGEAAATERMFDAVRFVFLHEIGHALIDAYDLPIAGNEEDAADRLSAFVNLRELGEDGVRAVFAAADAFALESKMVKPAKRNLADEHLLQEQRFYNSLCMIYGSNPAKYSNIVSENYLPKERAARCQSEYQRSVESWVKLLEPWRKG